MAMTVRELELQKKAKADEAKRLALRQAQGPIGPQEPARQSPIAQPEVAPVDPNLLRGAKPREFPPSRPVDLPVTPPGLKNVDDIRPPKPNLAPAYDPTNDAQTVEQWYASLPPNEQLRQRTQPGIAQIVAPPTQADMLRRKVMDPAKSFSEYGDKLAALVSLPFASKTDTAPPVNNRLVGTRDRGGNLQVFTPDEAARVMQEDEFQSALAAEGATNFVGDVPSGESTTARYQSVKDQPFKTLPDGSADLNSRLGALDTSRYNKDGTANNGIIGTPQGLRGAGGQYQPSQSNISYGLRDANGRRTMTINRPNPYAGMTDAQIAPIAEQKRQQMAARRLSGAAYGGQGLRNALSQIGRQAQQTFSDVRNATNNSKAAERAANAIYAQGDQLLREQQNQVGFGRNAAEIYGTDVYAETMRERTAADMFSSQQRAALDQRNADLASRMDYLKSVATEQNKDGEYVFNPQLFTRLIDQFGGEDAIANSPAFTRTALNVRTADRIVQNINKLPGIAGKNIAYQDLGQLFDLNPNGSATIRQSKISDMFNPNVKLDDIISAILPFGDPGEVIEGDAATLSADILEQAGMSPDFIRYLLKNRSALRRDER